MRTWLALEAHYGVYTTPRGVTPALFLIAYSKVPKFRNDQKQSVSNAFQYVVLHPCSSIFLREHRNYEADAFAKLRIYFESPKEKGKKKPLQAIML